MKATYYKWKIAVNKKANGSVTVCNNFIFVISPSLSKAWKDIKHMLYFRCKVGKGATLVSASRQDNSTGKTSFLGQEKVQMVLEVGDVCLE